MFTETLFPAVRKQRQAQVRLFSALTYFKTEICTFLKGALNWLIDAAFRYNK